MRVNYSTRRPQMKFLLDHDPVHERFTILPLLEEASIIVPPPI